MVEPVEVLRYARDVLLADESRWIQGNYIKGTKRCAMGALADACIILSADQLVRLDAEGELMKLVPNRSVSGWNDHPDRTYSQVIDLFDKGIKSLEDPA